MLTNYSIEEIKEYDEDQIREETGAEVVGQFFSGLSLIDLIKQAEERLLSSKFVKSIRKGYNSIINTIKKSKFAQKIALYGLVGTMIFGAGCNSNNQNNRNISDGSTSITQEKNDEPLIPETNLFNILLNTSKSEKQRNVLSSVGNFLADFNIRYATPIAEKVTLLDKETEKEKTITIKPALTWDEAMAMAIVYNNFSKDELAQILNGSEIDAYKLNNSYKMAILELMGAHVLENSNNPVRVDMLLQSQEAQNFYEKYHSMFLKCKETTGEERLNAVQKFYDEIYKDFPITAEVREEGIAHSDPRATIEPYKFSIVPMVAAAEIMFQNLEIDYTLSQPAIDYLNDIGACNIADDILQKAELVSLTTGSNKDYANYDEVREAMISFLTEENSYVIDDEHRDLSQLPAFIETVNGFLLEPYTYYIKNTYTVTEEYTVTETTTTSDRDEAVDLAGEDAVADAEKEAQDQLDQENQAAKDAAEQEADEKAEERQREEDDKREELEQQVEQDDQDLQDAIDDANNNINNGGTVNEGDLGHGTDIDDDHSNSNGDIDDSVKDITTDGSGAVSPDEPLPDPNIEMGSAYAYTIEPIFEDEPKQEQVEEIYEYEEPYAFSSIKEIDEYIEFQAAYSGLDNQVPFQYHL